MSRKKILCCKVSPSNKEGLKILANMKSRSVSKIVDTTITDLLKFHKIEVEPDDKS